jgi:hypothetical protein
MSEPRKASWTRIHRDGKSAHVIQHGEREFSASSTNGEFAPMTRNIRTLEDAQAEADRQSKCPQPCVCKSWFQDAQ